MILRLFLLLTFVLLRLQPLTFAYNAPVTFASEAQYVVASTTARAAVISDSAAPVLLCLDRDRATSASQVNLRLTVNFIAAETGTTTLFRAVNPAEMEDALANGLQPGPNSFATGKWFATNAEDATQWGNALNGPGNSQIMQVEFPSSTVDQFMQVPRLDGIGPARFGTFEQINSGTAPVIKLWGGP